MTTCRQYHLPVLTLLCEHSISLTLFIADFFYLLSSPLPPNRASTRADRRRRRRSSSAPSSTVATAAAAATVLASKGTSMQGSVVASAGPSSAAPAASAGPPFAPLAASATRNRAPRESAPPPYDSPIDENGNAGQADIPVNAEVYFKYLLSAYKQDNGYVVLPPEDNEVLRRLLHGEKIGTRGR